jgi:drug/metabolite transporter (DMT)-like permease
LHLIINMNKFMLIIIILLICNIISCNCFINIGKSFIVKRDSNIHSGSIYRDSDIIDIINTNIKSPPTSSKLIPSPILPINQDENDIKEEKTNFFPFQINGNDFAENIKWSEIKDSKWLARALLLTVSAFYGTNFGCVKILGESLDPSVAAAIRFTISALVFLPYLINVGRNNHKLVLGGLEVGLYCSLGYYAQAIALQTTNASNAAFICSLAVIVVPILDMLLGKKKSTTKQWYEPLLPATLAAAGVGCLELGGSDIPGVGDLWAFLQPLFFGLGFWRVESHMKNSSNPGEPQAFTGAMLSFVAIFSIVWASHDFLGPYLFQDMQGLSNAVMTQVEGLKDWHVIAALLWTGVVTTALTSYTENAAMKKLSATESTVIYSTEPLWGAAFASVALGEQLGWNHAGGAFLILTACMWSSVGSAVSIPAILSTSQSAFTNIVENVVENISRNWLEITASGALVLGEELVEDMTDSIPPDF